MSTEELNKDVDELDAADIVKEYTAEEAADALVLRHAGSDG